jgi:glycosyltransferase involved in cell wall biosynthesis
LPLIISGRQPSARLVRLIDQFPLVCLIANPSEEELQDLIAKAQVNILPSFNCTGIKLKLLNALYNGRHCIVNHGMVSGTGLENLCHIADGAEEMRSRVVELYSRVIQPEEIRQRREVLSGLYNKKENVHRLLRSIWADEPLAVDH